MCLLWSCDPCSDCGPSFHEPTVDLFFVNADSLKTTNDSLSVVAELDYFTDSLMIVNATLDTALVPSHIDELEDKKTLLRNVIDALTGLRLYFPDLGKADSLLSDSLSEISKELNAIVSTIENGDVLVDRITLVNSGIDSFRTENATSYTIPLHLVDTQSEYELFIENTQYELILEYKLFDEVDVDRIVNRSAENITVFSHSFDSVLVACDTLNADCTGTSFLDGQTIITCYF